MWKLHTRSICINNIVWTIFRVRSRLIIFFLLFSFIKTNQNLLFLKLVQCCSIIILFFLIRLRFWNLLLAGTWILDQFAPTAAYKLILLPLIYSFESRPMNYLAIIHPVIFVVSFIAIRSFASEIRNWQPNLRIRSTGRGPNDQGSQKQMLVQLCLRIPRCQEVDDYSGYRVINCKNNYVINSKECFDQI